MASPSSPRTGTADPGSTGQVDLAILAISMKRVSISDLKNRLSEFLRLVKKGETLEILERNVPIARIEGIRADPRSTDAYVEELTRRGILSRPKGQADLSFLKRPPIPCKADAVQVLMEARKDRTPRDQDEP